MDELSTGKILVVDDEQHVRDTVSRVLRKKGFQVEAADGAEAALKALGRFRPHVVLGDIRMPGMDGLDMVRQIKTKQPDTSVILMTAYASLDTAIEALKLGADDYIKKPIDWPHAFETIQAAFDKRKRLEEEILKIGERERQRIAQDLHDGLGQQLLGVAFMSKALAQKLGAKSLPEASDAAEITERINEAIARTRLLARALRPVELQAGGLMSALHELTSRAEKQFGISCPLKCDKPVHVSDNAAATHLYYIAQEAISNAIRHGKAKHVWIDLRSANGTIALTVKDDGVGLPEEREKDKGLGLGIMKHRAGMIGASLDVRRDVDGGTLVMCSFEVGNDKEK